MVLDLMIIAAIPTTIAIAEGVSERNKKQDSKKEDKLLRQFTLRCWCDGKSPGKRDIHGGAIVVGDDKVWVQSPTASPRRRLHRFEGFYIAYPDDERPSPPMGLVTRVEDDPPLMNWLYVDRFTSEIRHGNRTASRSHRVGDWGNTNQDSGGEEASDAEDAGGVDLDGMENFVAVQPPPGDTEGRWEVFWDQEDDKLGDGKEVDGRRVLRISLERTFIGDG